MAKATRDAAHEADLRGALDNDQSSTNKDKLTAKDSEDKADPAAKPQKQVDYQLARALDLLRGLRYTRSNGELGRRTLKLPFLTKRTIGPSSMISMMRQHTRPSESDPNLPWIFCSRVGAGPSHWSAVLSPIFGWLPTASWRS